MGDDVAAVLLVALILATGHLLTCTHCRQRTVDFLDTLVERVKYGRRKP